MPAMSGTQRIAAAVTAVLVVAIAAVVLLSSPGGPIGGGVASPAGSGTASPSVSASSSAGSTTEASSSASPSSDEEETLAALREIEDQVIALRGLARADIGDPDIITREELVDELRSVFDEEYPPEDRARDNAALRALGLLEPGQDVAELQLQLLGDQVLGFYDDVDKRMVVVSDAGLDPEAKMTYAHEYTHALQDANFGLDTLQTDAVGEDDRALARTALIEGDASITMQAWAFQHLSQQELIEIARGADAPDTTGVPSWMVDQLLFPYTTGQLWVSSLAGDDPLFHPDFAAIDAAWADPPDTTEQVMKPGAWSPREDAVPVEIPDLAAELGDGWDAVDTTPIGQASIEIFLQYHGVGVDAARTAAAGWGGDRVTIASGPDDAFAVAWILAWDTPADAAEFADAYRNALDALPFPASVTELPSGEILVAHASDDALLDQVETIAGG
jgi:hypothetical protein